MLAWIFAIVAVPFVGAFFYALFGTNHVRRKARRKRRRIIPIVRRIESEAQRQAGGAARERIAQLPAELQFVEVQARNTEAGLRSAEDRLQYFLQQNRSVSGSPELSFERDRLQRAVSLQQQLYGNMLQAPTEIYPVLRQQSY